jgi:endonuclease/exonuclease/phosphatase family metal-dependent hydrolase
MSATDNISTMTGAAEGFSALTFNLRFGLADDGANSWDHRKKGLPALFSTYRPDFIGLQEANDFQIDYLTDILAGYGLIGKYSPAPPDWQHNVIFFKSEWESTFYRHLFLSPTPSVPSRFRGSRWPRQCTIGMFANNHRRLVCINTHFDFAEDVQTKSARLIMANLSKLPSQAPAVLLGDFNATPKQNCYGIFTGGGRESPPDGPWFKNAAVKPFPGTHHGFNGRTNGEHIDWILYRGRIAPVAYRVVEGLFAGVYPSDHFPVYATFRWID